MVDHAARALRELGRRMTEYGNGAGRRKAALLRTLERRRLRRAAHVLQLHEALCFLRAYPDDDELLVQVERMLAGFAERGDLRRHRHSLINTGIAGTAIQFAFFMPTAVWLARNWGACLTVAWREFERQDKLEALLPLLALYCETPGLDEFAFDVREWVERMKGPDESDAAFLLRRLAQLRMSSFAQETLFEELDVPLRLSPGPDTPARTREKYDHAPIAYQSRPLSRARPSASDVLAMPPPPIHAVSPRAGQRLIDLARSTMATRSRDLDAFAYGDRNDVRLGECGDGLQLVYIGMIPERRLLLEAVCGFLMLKNGVPVGYGSHAGLFGSAEIAYTVFDTFRAGEAARMYGCVLAVARHLFGADTITVDPYQLGQDNDDALRSGAWWFYQKLGFEPRDAALRRIMRRELKRSRARRSYRSSAATLKKLAAQNVFLHLGKRRDDVLGVLPLANVGLRITKYLAERFGHDRAGAARSCARQAARLLGVRALRSFRRAERMAWQRWGPLVMILPGVARWPRGDKRALVEVVKAKGGRRESDYLLRFDRHRRLCRAIQTLAEET